VALSYGTLSTADAAPITFVIQGVMDGTLDGNAFSNRQYQITIQSDTLSREEDGPAETYFYDNYTATPRLQIDQFETVDFLIPIRTGCQILGQSGEVNLRNLDSTNLIWAGFTHASLGIWDMRSSIGPLHSTGLGVSWAGWPLETTGGLLVPTPGFAPATFTAIVVPEPSSLTLLVGAIGFASALARRRG